MQFLLPEPEPTADGGDDGARWNISPADANKWHQVTVMGRSHVSCNKRPGGKGERGWEGREEGRGEQQQQHWRQNVGGGRDKEMLAEQQQEGEGTGDGGHEGSAARARRKAALESSPSAFVVMFDSGRTTTLDLSDLSIKWIGFCGECEEFGVGVAVGINGGGDQGRPGSDRQAQAQARLPLGFGVGDCGGLSPPAGTLANDRTDVGTRVEVWWPRYNSYFRATVRVPER